MIFLNCSVFASRAEDNGCVSFLVSKFFIRKTLQKDMYWAKSWLGEYDGGSLLRPVLTVSLSLSQK